jgi:hypothetical protein
MTALTETTFRYYWLKMTSTASDVSDKKATGDRDRGRRRRATTAVTTTTTTTKRRQTGSLGVRTGGVRTG